MNILKRICIQIRKMGREDWKALCMLAISVVPGKIWKFFSPDMWVISEYESLARDNGFWTFKYVRENDPTRQVFYPINRRTSDYSKIASLGGVIEFGGIKHYMLFWAAAIQIGTTKCYGFPYRRICEDLVKWNLHGFKYVFLNHGYTRGESSILKKEETNYDLVFTCSEKDRNIIVNENGQPEKLVKNVGFSRHDTLNSDILNKNQILVMPTWRKWIDYRLLATDIQIEQNIENYLKSSYYIYYQNLLDSDILIHFLEDHDLTLIFYLHEYAQEYFKYFNVKSERIIIGKSEVYSIQELLRASALLITDYSSVCYDFAYMYKPVLYYQFDLEEFEKNQYATGENFSYEKDGFGQVLFKEEELVKAVMEAYDSGFQMSKKFCDRVDEFFDYHDNNNCKRVYQEIKKIARK